MTVPRRSWKVGESYVVDTHAGAGELVFGASDLLRAVKGGLRETRKSGVASASVHFQVYILIAASFSCQILLSAPTVEGRAISF